MLIETKNVSTKIFLTLFIIFVLIICLLGLPFTHWGFLHDDFGVVYHAWVAGSNIPQLFSEGSMTAVVQPSNYIIPEQSCFAVLYRPLVYVFLHAQMWLFGISPYALLLITIFFHALNAVLIFLLLLPVSNLWASCCAALLFVFHLSLWDWIGWIAGQNQVINLTLLLFIIILIKRYLDRQQTWYLLPAYVLYCLSLFYREELLILPIWLLIAVPVYCYYQTNQFAWKKVARTAFNITSGFWVGTLFYACVRLYNFPLKASGSGIKGHLSIGSFIISLKGRFFDAVTLLSDIANLAWLSGGNRLLKGSLIGLFLIGIIYLFYKNKNKLLLLFCFMSMVMFMWPAIWRYYSSRFLYMSLPFLVTALVLLITRYSYKNKFTQKRWVRFMTIGCFGLTIVNATALFMHMKKRESSLHDIAQAFYQLAAKPFLKNKALCFIGLPYDIFVTGVAQAMWLHGIETSTPIYYDNTTFVWRLHDAVRQPITITPIDKGFRLASKNLKEAWFLITNTCMPMGEKIIEQEEGGKIFAMTYHIDPNYLLFDHVWITWDYQRNCFMVLSV